MTDDEHPGWEQPKWDGGSLVALSLIEELVTKHPDWRLVSHHTDEGRKMTMIEFADEDGEFTTGLPGDFIEMVAQAERGD